MSPLLLLHHLLPVPCPSATSCWANHKWLYVRFVQPCSRNAKFSWQPLLRFWARDTRQSSAQTWTVKCFMPPSTFHDHQTADFNYSLNHYDIVVADETSLVLPASFSLVAATLNRLNCRPVVVISGDKKQQQPLQTVDGRVPTTRSILNDNTFGEQNAVKHALYQQFRVLDRDYGAFLDLLRYLQPKQEQLDDFQQSLILCPSGPLDDDQLFKALNNTSDTLIMIISGQWHRG